MPLDDVLFQRGQFHILFCILTCLKGMGKPVNLSAEFSVMPVIEEVVMQQGPKDKGCNIRLNIKYTDYAAAHVGNTYAMDEHRNVAMLDIAFGK